MYPTVLERSYSYGGFFLNHLMPVEIIGENDIPVPNRQ